MDDEQYREAMKYISQMIETVVQIPERYFIDEGTVIEIGELSKEDMQKIDEMCGLFDPSLQKGLLTIDRNIDISRELAMILKAQIKNFIKQIGEGNADS